MRCGVGWRESTGSGLTLGSNQATQDGTSYFRDSVDTTVSAQQSLSTHYGGPVLIMKLV